MYIATKSQMKKYDARLIEEGYPIETLVDKASNCILPHCISYDNISVFCGIGNNGADGISLAIKLHKLNKKIIIYLVGDYSKASKAYHYYLEIAKDRNMKIEMISAESLANAVYNLNSSELIIDAIFGFGLNSNPRGIAADIISAINQTSGIDILAVDIPTGLQCDTGIPYKNTICATKTITLTAYKQGFLNPESKYYTGEIILEELETKDFRKEQGLSTLLCKKEIESKLKKRKYYGYKGIYGQILHITGCDDYKGTALLSAKASVYSGSGIVTVASTSLTLSALTQYVPEAISLLRNKPLADKFNKYDSILIGPGLGLTEASHFYVKELLKNANVPLVIDADALTIAADNKELLKQYRHPIILTPHLGEFKRLVPNLEEYDIVEAAVEFAKKYSVILILKGPNSLITDGEKTYRNRSANPTMATAGAGDALAGILVSLLGQKYEPLTAALLGTYIHGVCGDNLAKENYTSVTSKLIEEIPKVMHKIEKNY